MIGTVKEMILPPLVETEATAVFITGVVARGSAMGMVVTGLSHVDGGESGVKRAVGTMPWHVCWAGGEAERPPSSVRAAVKGAP